MGRLGVVLFVLLCAAMAGGVYYVTIHQPTEELNRVETVDGTVEATDIDRETGDNGPTWSPVVTYTYTYEGESYTSDEFKHPGTTGGSQSDAEETLSEYAAGDSVTVYVDPENPSFSFLVKGSVPVLMYPIVGFLGLMSLVGVFALVDDLLGLGFVNIK